ncbi:hypothetical protein HYZ70_01880 [Candidatus Curtissbacteria bacterium]|nr:hypothetical protein [Candidatus Curtissbacteria bacterium]
MNKYLAATFILLTLALIAGLGYSILQNQKLIKTLATPSPSPEIQSEVDKILQSPSPSPSASPTLTKIQLQANIKDAINSKNFAPLETYMTTPTVNFIIMSSECCGPQTPSEAISQLSYIEDGTPMDFNQENPTIKNLKAKNSRLTEAYAGISQSKEHLIAITINQQNKIGGIEVSVSWKLYEQ